MDGDGCGLVCCGDVGGLESEQRANPVELYGNWSMASWMYEVFNDSAVVFAFVSQMSIPIFVTSLCIIQSKASLFVSI
jgi:hypothetical protein